MAANRSKGDKREYEHLMYGSEAAAVTLAGKWISRLREPDRHAGQPSVSQSICPVCKSHMPSAEFCMCSWEVC